MLWRKKSDPAVTTYRAASYLSQSAAICRRYVRSRKAKRPAEAGRLSHCLDVLEGLPRIVADFELLDDVLAATICIPSHAKCIVQIRRLSVGQCD
jgi:hypothetical protein